MLEMSGELFIKITRKALAVFLVLTLISSVLPMSAFAKTTPDPMTAAVEAVKQSGEDAEGDA
jgi:hypothetical protein